MLENRFGRPKAGHVYSTKYRPDIDGLRAVAVALVVCYHAFPALVPGGFVGVDIFFVISGYLITGILLDEIDTTGISIRRFYARRILRIFPALCVLLIACLGFGWIALLADEYTQLGKHVAAASGFVSNIILWQESGYFDNSAITKPLLHLWSLGVEEQFYIFWPLLLIVASRFKAPLILIIVILAGASFAYSLSVMTTSPVTDFYSPITRFWELLVGGALAWGRGAKFVQLGNAGRQITSVVGAVLIGASVYLIDDTVPFPGWIVALPVAGAAIMIASGPATALGKWVLGNRVFVGVGLISYPLYLWHWPLLSFPQIVRSEETGTTERIVLVVASIVLAAATYFLLQRPLRFGRFRRVKIAGLAILMACIGLCGIAVFYRGGLANRPAVAQMVAVNAEFVSGEWQYAQNDACLNRYPFPDTARLTWWFCMTNRDEPPDIAILGNSYANQLYPGFAQNESFGDKSILSFGTCPAIKVADPGKTANDASPTPCVGRNWFEQQEFIDAIISDNPSLRYLVLDGFPPAPDAGQVDRIVQRVGDFVAAGRQVIVFTPHLRLEGNIKSCFARPFRRPQLDCTITEEQHQAWLAGFQPVIEAIRSKYPDVKFFDQTQAFCGNDGCSFVVDGMPMIRDQYNHESAFASRRVVNQFAEWARQNLPEMVVDRP